MNRTMTVIRQAILASVLLSATVAQADPAPSPTARSYSVPAGDLATALEAFSKQSGVELVFQPDQVKGQQTKGVDGIYTSHDAVKRLLEGTTLRLQIDEKTGAMMIGSQRTASTDGRTTSVSRDERVGVSRDERVGQGEEINTQAETSSRSEEENKSRSSADNARKVSEVEEVLVTGTHIAGESITSPVLVITRDDIDRQGLATAADIVRSLPQNFSSVNPGSSVVGASGTIPQGAQGTASADLRGLGPSATLVLVNGRRLGGSAVFDSGQINLSTIPSSAIERVEVILDGASAIYGSDAIAGVINFILKRDYSGSTTKVRYDNSAFDADSFTASQTIGFGWGSGNLLAAFEYSKADPVNLRKVGDVTSNLTSQGGADYRPEDFLSPTSPGNIFFFGRLPDSFDGTESWTAADLIPLSDSDRYDYKAGDVSGTTDSETSSLTLSMKQAFGQQVEGFLDVIYSRSKNTSLLGNLAATFILVPASNPFNRLGEDVFVSYLIRGNRADQFTSDFERINVSTGANINLPFKQWKLSLAGTYGAEKAEGGGGLFYDFTSAAATENLFGNGSALDVSRFLVRSRGEDRTRDIRSFEAVTNGRMFGMWGGDAKLALGINYRPQKLDLSDAPGTIAIANPISSSLEMDNIAYFFEMSLPLVGSRNSIPGVQNLMLSVAGRYEDYQMDGHFLGDAFPAETKSFTNFSPRFGLLWTLSDEWTLRGSWGESFRAPNLTDLGGAVEYFPDLRFPVVDPRTGETVNVIFGRGGNPDLQPETAETLTFGTEWRPSFIQGLSVSANYTDIRWSDRIERIRGLDPRITNPDALGLLIYDLPVELGGDGNPDTLDSWPTRPINIASRDAEFVDAMVGYRLDTSRGRFDFDVSGMWALKTADRVVPDTPSVELSGTEVGPDKKVAKAHLGWSAGSYGANLYAHYSSSYNNLASLVQDRVSQYATYDLTGSVSFARGLKIQGGILNLTNEKFPFFDSRFANYDSTRVDSRGRLIYVEVAKAFDF